MSIQGASVSIDGVDTDGFVLVVHGTASSVYHLDPDCRALRQTTRTPRLRPAAQYPNRECCQFCSGEFEPHVSDDFGGMVYCECGATADGTDCGFCDRFDAIHDVPPAIDLDWLRRFAAAPEVFVR